MRKNVLKKLLGLLGTISLTVPTTILAVSCSTNTKKINIAIVIEKKSLGIINKPTEYEIRQAVLLNNPKLVTSDFEITNISTSESSGKATLIGQDKYNGEITVSFYIVPALEDNIINTDLGTISNKSESTIRNAILSKNPDININGFEITEIDSTSALIIGNDFIYNGSLTVVFTLQTIKPNLSSVITKKDLGILSDNNVLTIQQAVIKLNPKLTTKDINITSITQTSARVNSSASGRYTGSVNVTFTIQVVKQNLSSVLINTNLGNLQDNNASTIQASILAKNSNLLASDISIDYITQTSARVNSSASGRYTGSVNVTFTIQVVKQNLSSVLINTNLGNLQDNNASTIQASILAKNSNLLASDISIDYITQTSARVNSSASGRYTGSVYVSFTIQVVKQNLSSVLVNTNLGSLQDNNASTIQASILAKNSNLLASDISIDYITQTSARVNSSASGRYTGSVNVTFTINGTKPEKTNLTNVITNKNITTVLPNADPDLILNALVKDNSKLNSNYVRIYDAGFNSSSGWGWARVTSTNENVYINPKEGYLDLTFEVDENLLAIDLASVITNTNLGTLNKLDEITIKSQLSKLNSNLEVNYVDINNITETSAIVTSNSPSKYKGSVNITFKLDTSKAVPLSSVLKQTNLGTLSSTDENTIKQVIKSKNPNIDINAIGIDSQSITISNALVKSTDPTKYSGSVKIEYIIDTSNAVDLSTLIKERNLKGISDNLDSGIIRNILKFNPNTTIQEKDLKVINKTNEVATIQSNNLAKYKGSVQVQYEVKTLVGYHYDWGGNFENKIALNDKDLLTSSYNVINLSFLYSTVEYQMPTYSPNNPAAIKEGVKALQSQGKRVLISMGGATAEHMKFRNDQKDQLKTAIKSVINEYGFDGLDIDWESESLKSSESKNVTAEALKELKDEYKSEGKDFIITMAPEFPYLRKIKEADGNYKEFLDGLDGYYDWINPQFYNGWGDGVLVETSEDAKKTGVQQNTYITNDNVDKRGEFYYLMSKYITSKPNNQNGFYQIPADKFIIGASTNEPAGRGAGSKEAFNKAYNLLNSDGIKIRGLMTWSILFDAFEGMIPDTYGGTEPKIMWYRWSYSKWFDESFGKLQDNV
ncbi:chitinase [Mesoplasma florum L1]|uniref:chitinase n=1 Tax=Mesoplasma florum (strain ATCC 33453 / NBRC 100688 / NCTC 11704 / L1) TaxID=265311 RepID=Q6F1B9_MESFL|nr:chitinase [Mesoplasma florum L1]